MISDDNDNSLYLEDQEDAEEARMNTELISDVQNSLSELDDTSCPGFVLVIDNIDLHIRRSEQRVDHTTQLYHFCHAYALLNRVDSTQLPDQKPSGTLSLELILPSQKDLDNIMEDFAVLVSRYDALLNEMLMNIPELCRILVRHMSKYNNDELSVKWHIPSSYTNEMSKQSVVVSDGYSDCTCICSY